MKIRFCSRSLSLSAVSLLICCYTVSVAQDTKSVTVPQAEQKAALAVQSAPDVNAKMAAAADFVTKYPKSAARRQVADHIVSQILDVSAPDQKFALAQKYSTVFTNADEAELIKPALIDAYTKLNKFDEAFSEGASYLSKHPDNIQVLVLLAITGVEQAKQNNPKYLNASRDYGAKAIAFLEADKQPADMDVTVWTRQKQNLPRLYQELAIINLMERKPADAQAKLEKSLKLDATDPYNYLLLGGIVNDEYQKLAQTYSGMPAGKDRDATLEKINGLLDKVIDLYAHAVGLSEGKPQYEKFHNQLLQDLSSYYRYRHKGTDGLQDLINRYKQP